VESGNSVSLGLPENRSPNSHPANPGRSPPTGLRRRREAVTVAAVANDYLALPADLPAPVDDGACRHLPGLPLPPIRLPSTGGGVVDLSEPVAALTVIYIYPMTGVPGVPLPAGWDAIPGARGCTPQSCAFRDRFNRFAGLGCRVFGLSSQTTAHQSELKDRLHLPFELLSDAHFAFAGALRLPTFEVEGRRLLRRVTLILNQGRIEHVFYPVFPPNRSADQVLDWLATRPLSQ
jgi:peroxiredoxin